MAPITTAVLFMFNPTEHTIIEQAKIHRFVPLNTTPCDISLYMVSKSSN